MYKLVKEKSDDMSQNRIAANFIFSKPTLNVCYKDCIYVSRCIDNRYYSNMKLKIKYFVLYNKQS